MADPFSITTGVIGLLPIVKQGFILVTDVLDAKDDLVLALGRVEMQRGALEAWEDQWVDVNSSRTRRGLDKKFRAFADAKPRLAQLVLKQLILLLQVFGDSEKLKKKYGLDIHLTDSKDKKGNKATAEISSISSYLLDMDKKQPDSAAKALQEKFNGHMKFFKRIRFVIFGGKKDFDELITLLKEFIGNLREFTSAWSAGGITGKIFEDIGRGSRENPNRAKRVAAAAAHEAEHADDPQARADYGDMAKFAQFAETIRSEAQTTSRLRIWSRTEFSFDSPYKLGPSSTLARFLDFPTKVQSRLVLIEWISIESGSVEERLKETKKLCTLLRAEKPAKLLLPYSSGIIHDDSHKNKIGIVLRLPSRIRQLPTCKDRPLSARTIAKERKPTSLRDMIENTRGIALGTRLRLSKQFIDALHLMHCVGWLHKNIRSDCILFFPAQGKNRKPDPEIIDYAHPFFVGFNNARLELEVDINTNDRVSSQSRNIILDCYQHPAKRRDVKTVYRPQYDLYSVGCVLLELGLWKNLEDIENGSIKKRKYYADGKQPTEREIDKDAEDIRRAAEGLDFTTGSIYAGVVRDCLSVAAESPDTDVLELERKLAGTLAQCVA